MVNLSYILQAAFVPISFAKKLQSQAVTKEKLRKTITFKKVQVKY